MQEHSPDSTDSSAAPAPAPRRLFGYWYVPVLAAILAGALFLRWKNADFGLPALYHPDEDNKVRVVMRFYRQRTADPNYFKHPAFLLYSLAAVGWTSNLVAGVKLEPLELYMLGRRWVGLLGVLTVLCTFFLAREAAAGLLDDGPEEENRAPPDWRANLAGLVAAGLLAVTPLHAILSHYVKEDVPLAFWSTLALIFYLRIARCGRRRDYVLAAVFTGLALATKYSAACLLPLLLAAHVVYVLRHRDAGWIWGGGLRIPGGWKLAVPIAAALGILLSIGRSPGTYAANAGALAAVALFVFRAAPAGRSTHWKWRTIAGGLLLLLVVAAVFAVLNPYAIINAGQFREDFGYEREHALKGHQGIRVSPWKYLWSFHLIYSLAPGMGWPLLILALVAALGLLAARKPEIRVLQLATLLWYLAHEASALKPAPNFDRYMAPVLPPLCALLALGLVWILVKGLRAAGDSPARRLAAGGVFAAALCAAAVPATVRCWRLVDQLIPDTRDRLAVWLRENAHPECVVARTLYTGAPQSARFRILRPKRLISESGHRLNLDSGLFEWPDKKTGEPRSARLDYVILSSYWVNRFRMFGEGGDEFDAKRRRFYDQFERQWGPPVTVIEAPLGSYGFNNPIISIYRNPATESDSD